MSIRERRLNKAINQILREELQKGNLPSSKEFVWKLNQYLQDNDISGPSYKFKPVRKGSVARSKDLNQTLEAVYSDFDTLYVSVIEQHNASIKHFNKYEIEKAKLDYEIGNLENKLKELILLYAEEGFLNSVYDMFTDFSQIDGANTTANVDIASHEVKMDNVKSRSRKIVPNAIATFDILSEIKNVVEGKIISGSPQDALSNSTNSTWQYEISSPTKMDVGGYYVLTFATKQEMNKIALSLHSVKPVYIRIEFSPDNVNWILLPYYEQGVSVSKDYTFDFPSIEVNSLRILMGKTEPDNETIGKPRDEGIIDTMKHARQLFPDLKTDGEPESRRYFKATSEPIIRNDAEGKVRADSVKNTYLFGIKNIFFFYNTYSLESKLTSRVLQAENVSGKNFTIDRVSLVVDEELPNGTEIKYYIALPPASGEPEWKSISPVNRANPQYDQMIDYKNISTSVPNVFKIDPSISIGEYEQESLYANGIKFYKVGEVIDRKIIEGTEKLFVGKNTWGKKSYALQHADNDHEPSLNDWRLGVKPVINYAKIEDGRPGVVLHREKTAVATNYMFTLGVFSNKAQEVVTVTPASTDPIAIFMNGKLLFSGIPTRSTKVTFLFENKWNEIIVLVYTSKTVGSVNGATVDLNLDPRKYGSNVYSKAKPLTRVPIFDLRYNVNASDTEKFAVVEVNNKSQVILNHATPGLEYEFFYNYIDGTANDEILFKAELKRDDSITNTSPKLKSYRLRFS